MVAHIIPLWFWIKGPISTLTFADSFTLVIPLTLLTLLFSPSLTWQQQIGCSFWLVEIPSPCQVENKALKQSYFFFLWDVLFKLLLPLFITRSLNSAKGWVMNETSTNNTLQYWCQSCNTFCPFLMKELPKTFKITISAHFTIEAQCRSHFSQVMKKLPEFKKNWWFLHGSVWLIAVECMALCCPLSSILITHNFFSSNF